MSKYLKFFYIILIILFLYTPVIILILFSFNSSNYIVQWHGFTLKWYKEIFNGSRLNIYLFNSIKLSIYSIFISVILAFPLALFINFQSKYYKKFLYFFLYLQIIIPEIIMGISLAIFFSIIKVTLSLTTMLYAHVTFCIGFFTLSFISRVDENLWLYYLAGLDLGLSKIIAIIKILMPITISPFIASVFFVLAISLDNFVISFFTSGLGSTTIPIVLFSSIRHGIDPILNAEITLIFLIVLLLLSLSISLTKIKKGN